MATLSPRALIGLDDVKAFANIDPNEDEDDDLLIDLINAASQSFYSLAQREFKPIRTNPQTRTFDLPASSFWSGAPWRRAEFFVGDLASFDAVTVNGTTISGGAVTGLPRVREEWQPITRLRFDSTVAVGPSAASYDLALVTVHGNFGFPAVPEDIKQACRVTVASWSERSLKTFSEVFNSEQGALLPLPDLLPRQAYRTVLAYRKARL